MPRFDVLFTDGPFEGRRGEVTTTWRPHYLYVLADGGIIDPDRIIANDHDALELSRGASLYGVLDLGPVDGPLRYGVRRAAGPPS